MDNENNNNVLDNENNEDDQDRDENEIFIDCCLKIHRDLKAYISENSLPLLENLTMNSLEEFVDE